MRKNERNEEEEIVGGEGKWGVGGGVKGSGWGVRVEGRGVGGGICTSTAPTIMREIPTRLKPKQ
jgi:hypothetical protein